MSHIKKKKQNTVIALLLIVWGLFMLAEGTQITAIGQISSGTPYWIIAVAGLIFLSAGPMVLINNQKSKWNDLLGAAVTALMGSIGGWVALFTAESDISGSGKILTELTGLPTGRIMFGFGALLCFFMSAYALKQFYTKSKKAQR